MHLAPIAAFAASLTTVSSQAIKGFNYGSTASDGTTPITNYAQQFTAAKNLVGTTGFTSARLYTMIQAGTAGTSNQPTLAIQAAIDTQTKLLLGLWASAGEAGINQELSALSAAVAAHGKSFTDLILGISVGSEDLYRISPTGIINKSGIGAEPDELVNYINQVKSVVNNTPDLKGKQVGHVDTWTAWVNGSNDAVINAADFIGTDAYPYFQTTMTNPIEEGASLFKSAYEQTVAAANGKPVWVTETGWPVSGKLSGQAQPSLSNAKTYWDQIGCDFLFGKINTFWYTLQDDVPSTPDPSFGIVNAGLSTTPLYDLSCSGASSAKASKSSPTTKVPAASAKAVGNAGSANEASAAKVQGEGSGNTKAAAPAAKAPAKAAAPAGSSGGEVTVDTTVISTVTSCPGGCDKAAGVAAPATTLITQTSALPAAAAEATGCPASLTGKFEFPHLIVPVDKNAPTKAGGTSYNGTVSSTVSSIFNFDILESEAGKTCTLVFLLPKQSDLKSSAFTLSGAGGIDATILKGIATEQTSYNTVPAAEKDFGTIANVTPGNEYVVASNACPAGQTISIELKATGSLALDYFQDYNPSPIGLYVTVC